MKVTSYEYPDCKPFGMIVIELQENVEADYGHQVVPGVHVHYKKSADGREIPVYIEIENNDGSVGFDRRGKNDEPLPLSGGIPAGTILAALANVGVEVTSTNDSDEPISSAEQR